MAHLHRRSLLLSAVAAWACKSSSKGETGAADSSLGTTGLPPVSTATTGATADTGKPSETAASADTATPPEDCDDDVVMGTLTATLPFLDEADRDLELTYGDGLDGRRVLDLTTLTVDDLVLPQERLFLRTAAPLGLGDGTDWQISVTGEVKAPFLLHIDEILAQMEPMGVVHFECSGNTNYGGFGLQGAVDFTGVPFQWVLDQVAPTAQGTPIRITGLDDHPPTTGTSIEGASWVFRPEELADAFLATHIGGERLSEDHGYPVRLMVPGWYGCASIKWVQEIAWVGDDEPATTQMMEFASRTMQSGVPQLARDYAPAEIDVAACPVRVEVWDLAGAERVRVIGIVWGGPRPPTTLRLWANGVDMGPVEVCPARPDATTWALWHVLLPEGLTGRTELTLTVDDTDLVTRRLDTEYYLRTVEL